MGIRGLTTLLRNEFSSFSNRVDLTRLSTLQLTPVVLVVDGNSFAHAFVTNIHGKFAPYRTNYSIIHLEIQEWIENCSSAGISLIFVFDGALPEQKLFTRISRIQKQRTDLLLYSLNNAMNHASVSHEIQSGVISLGSVPVFLNISSVIEAISELSCCTYFIAEGEADPKIVEVAINSNAFGIISNDSDFLCYDFGILNMGLIPFWTMDFASDGSLCANIIYGKTFESRYGLPRKAMSYISALAGNDFSNQDTLRLIHQQILHPPAPPPPSSYPSTTFTLLSSTQYQRMLMLMTPNTSLACPAKGNKAQSLVKRNKSSLRERERNRAKKKRQSQKLITLSLSCNTANNADTSINFSPILTAFRFDNIQQWAASIHEFTPRSFYASSVVTIKAIIKLIQTCIRNMNKAKSTVNLSNDSTMMTPMHKNNNNNNSSNNSSSSSSLEVSLREAIVVELMGLSSTDQLRNILNNDNYNRIDNLDYSDDNSGYTFPCHHHHHHLHLDSKAMIHARFTARSLLDLLSTNEEIYRYKNYSLPDSSTSTTTLSTTTTLNTTMTTTTINVALSPTPDTTTTTTNLSTSHKRNDHKLLLLSLLSSEMSNVFLNHIFIGRVLCELPTSNNNNMNNDSYFPQCSYDSLKSVRYHLYQILLSLSASTKKESRTSLQHHPIHDIYDDNNSHSIPFNSSISQVEDKEVQATLEETPEEEEIDHHNNSEEIGTSNSCSTYDNNHYSTSDNMDHRVEEVSEMEMEIVTIHELLVRNDKLTCQPIEVDISNSRQMIIQNILTTTTRNRKEEEEEEEDSVTSLDTLFIRLLQYIITEGGGDEDPIPKVTIISSNDNSSSNINLIENNDRYKWNDRTLTLVSQILYNSFLYDRSKLLEAKNNEKDRTTSVTTRSPDKFLLTFLLMCTLLQRIPRLMKFLCHLKSDLPSSNSSSSSPSSSSIFTKDSSYHHSYDDNESSVDTILPSIWNRIQLSVQHFNFAVEVVDFLLLHNNNNNNKSRNEIISPDISLVREEMLLTENDRINYSSSSTGTTKNDWSKCPFRFPCSVLNFPLFLNIYNILNVEENNISLESVNQASLTYNIVMIVSNTMHDGQSEVNDAQHIKYSIDEEMVIADCIQKSLTIFNHVKDKMAY